MENFYTAYTKTIDGTAFHFVKHFQTFPEYKNVPPLLQNYGMHTDFYKACKIAMITDKTIQQQLFDAVAPEVISMNRGKATIYTYRRRPINLSGLLGWIGVRRLLHFRQRIA